MRLQYLTPALICALLSSVSCEPSYDPARSPEYAEVTILNKSNELHQLTIYPLRDTLLFSGGAPATAAGLTLDHFALERPFAVVSLFSGQEIGIDNTLIDYADQSQGYYYLTEQRIWLVRSPALPPIIVSWAPRAQKQYYFSIDVPQEVPADPGTVVIEADYANASKRELHPWRYQPCEVGPIWDCEQELVEEALRIPQGARYSWRSVDAAQLHRQLPSPPQTPRCQAPAPSTTLAWDVSSASLAVSDALVGLDGCTLIQGTDEGGGARSWTLCAPQDMLEVIKPSQAELVTLSATSVGLDAREALQVTIQRYTAAGVALRTHRLTLLQEASRLPLAGFIASYETPDGCTPSPQRCRIDAPIQIAMTQPARATLSPGQRIALPGLRTTLHIASAGHRIAQDLSCDTSPNEYWIDAALLEETSR